MVLGVILGHYLTIMKWHLRFRPKAVTISKTLVWVRFSKLYLEMLEEKTIANLGNMIGRIVKVGALSLAGTRGKFVRCCVEVDLSAPLLPSVTLSDEEQKVEYEGVHLICFKCGRYGHRVENCPEGVGVNIDRAELTGSKTKPNRREAVKSS